MRHAAASEEIQLTNIHDIELYTFALTHNNGFVFLDVFINFYGILLNVS